MRFVRATVAVMLLAGLPAATTVRPPGHRDAPARPSILLIVADDQAWSDFSPTLMPRVFSDIVGPGVLFDRAYASSPICCPSRSEMLTGLWEHHTGVDGNSVALDRPTLPMALHDAGYATMMAGKYLNSWTSCAPRPEFDRWSCLGTPEPSTYSQVDPWINVDGTFTHFTGLQTDILARQVVDFIQATPQDTPFFALYSPTTPHSPADDPRYGSMPIPAWRPASYDAETRTADTPLYARRFPLGATTISATDRFYRDASRSVRGLDDGVGTLLDGLGDRAANTLVIYVSDNGYLFGEHRRVGKFDPYEEAVHVPMAIRYPPLQPTGLPHTQALAANVDLAPTIAELAGLPWHADGVSLVPLIRGDPGTVRDAVLLERCQGEHLLHEPCGSLTLDKGVRYPPAYTGVVTSRYKLVHFADGSSQLFDLRADPAELTNLAGHDDMAAVQAQLDATLTQLLQEGGADTTIATGPSGPVADRAAGFTFFSRSRFATLRCRLVRAGVADPWHDCSGGSDVTGDLADGDYAFEVAGTDEHGNTDPTPAVRAFSVVTDGGPGVHITAGPAGAQRGDSATFAFASATEDGSFECHLIRWGTHGAWTPCDPDGQTYTGLGDGTWVFEVRATDPLTGEHSDPPASRVVEVDTQGPSLRVWARPPNVSGATTATFGFSPDEALAGGMTCTLDGGAPSDCTSGSVAYSGLGEGPHSLAVSARDVLGNGRTSFITWQVDLTPPVETLITGPPAFTKTTSATFTMSSSETPQLFVCTVDAFPQMPCSTSWTIGPLANGTHVLTARAVDAAGNRSSPVTRSWTVDTVKPVVTITSGPKRGSSTTLTSATIRFTTSEPATTWCSRDGKAFAICTSPVTMTGLAKGPHSFAVYAVDPAANRSTTRIRSWTVV